MNKRILSVLLVCMLGAACFAGSAAVSAQAPAWQITLFDTQTGTVSTLMPDGLRIGASFPQILMLGQITRAEMTPDGRYLVFNTMTTASDKTVFDIYVGDTVTGECCRKLQDPLNSVMDISLLGPISPDGTQVVAALASNQAVYGSANIVGLVSVFDIASGIVRAATDVSHLQTDPGMMPQIAAIGEWKPDGIRLIAGCLACEGVWGGRYQIWNPVNNTITPPLEAFSIFKHKLAATGELVTATLNSAYPESGAMSVYIPPANVVEYFGNSDQPTGQVIYFNPVNKYINEVEWVADGNAIVVSLAGPLEFDPGGQVVYPGQAVESYVVLRSGGQIPLIADIADVFAATPDGWLSRSSVGMIFYTQIIGGQLQTTQIASGAGDRVVASNFTPGTSAAGAFPVVPPPVPTVCPGFLPSRLSVNSVGQVTPGAANNLRDQPSSNGASVGAIPAEGTFITLAGPTCAENMAWWQVNYNGVIGWTAEGQGSEYWTQPVTGQ